MTQDQTAPSPDPLDEEIDLDDARLRSVREALSNRDRMALDDLLEPLHGADIADLLEQITELERASLIELWQGQIDGEILSELDESLREEVLDALPAEDVAEAVRELDTDDVVDLVENLDDEDQADAILGALDDVDRVAVETALSYPEYSAGRLMQREVVVAPSFWSVGQAIDFLRNATDLPEHFYHVILTDPRMRPVGYVTLGKILGAPRDTALSDIEEDSFRTFDVTDPEEDVAYAFNQYHLISAPVVDADDRLMGVITIDDAIRILDEEAEEDILRLAGVDADEAISNRTRDVVRRRFPWLAVNLVTSILASLVIAQFDAVITQIVALAVLMPIVASMGGNAGTQSLTVAVRALATRDLTGANVWRVIRREVAAGAINGAAFAVIMGIVGVVWFGSPMLGVVIAVAMVINLIVAGLAGVGIPVILEKVGVDPALASGAFVTTVTDVVGFFAFLGLAALWLL
ncbi:magnesium transporter MgtE [Jannaschia pagri]|uniref:Magnesium transporter MgtE n=1 Tax=Jannaschia pagri TaxID=2829797 RepID=A0ABQ4NGS4_9RHOB|nr:MULTISPECIES: magnesium transporter [unclassified Jannaschia]GIT90414.1 magnesium transporter MgtE [Jannaschia sp. AI_61]GIT93481.1 magnesium transporter MgtE [Jannaschia sp. AI_62]